MIALVGGGLIHLDFARWCAHSFGAVVFVDIACSGSKRKKFSSDCADKWFDARLELVPSSAMTLSELYFARDKTIADLSNVLVAVAVRRGGAMEKIGRQAIKDGKRVLVLVPPLHRSCYLGNFELLEGGGEKLDISLSLPQFEKNTFIAPIVSEKIPARQLDGWLWHYTREHVGPWHEQSWDSYFTGLINCAPDSARTPFDTLLKILEEEKIRGSGKLIKGGEPVVCWTSNSPLEILSRRSYRKALARWEYHPYAVAIKQNIAEKVEIKPVICASSNEYKLIPQGQRYLYKQLDTKGNNKWAEQDEWRCRGDFLLTDVHPSEGLVLVSNSYEKSIAIRKSRFPVVSLDEITQ